MSYEPSIAVGEPYRVFTPVDDSGFFAVSYELPFAFFFFVDSLYGDVMCHVEQDAFLLVWFVGFKPSVGLCCYHFCEQYHVSYEVEYHSHEEEESEEESFVV